MSKKNDIKVNGQQMNVIDIKMKNRSFGITFPYSIITIFAEDEKIFELLQHENGTVTSKSKNIGKAADILFKNVLEKAQRYALDYLKG